MRLLLVLAALLGVSVGYEDKTVVQYLQDNGFSVLSKLINDAGLTSTLSGSGTYFIFNLLIQYVNKVTFLVTIATFVFIAALWKYIYIYTNII